MKSITAMICITSLTAFSIWHNFDGTIIMSGLLAISGIAGYDLSRKATLAK